MPCLRELGGRGDVWLAAIAWGCDGVGTKDILQLKGTCLWIAANKWLPLSTTGAVECSVVRVCATSFATKGTLAVCALERDGPKHWRVAKCIRWMGGWVEGEQEVSVGCAWLKKRWRRFLGIRLATGRSANRLRPRTRSDKMEPPSQGHKPLAPQQSDKRDRKGCRRRGQGSHFLFRSKSQVSPE